MFDIGGGELILIVLVALILFGPKKIPEIASMFGKGMSHVRKAQSQFRSQMNTIQHEMTSVVKDEPYNIKGPPKKETPEVSEGDISKAINTRDVSSDYEQNVDKTESSDENAGKADVEQNNTEKSKGSPDKDNHDRNIS